MKVTRRGFIKTSAIVSGVLATGLSSQTAFKALAAASDSPVVASGEWKATTCQGCTHWCSAQAYVIDGRAVKVRGNPNSKTGLGRLCVRGHFGLQEVYDPDRIKVPMRRTNAAKGKNHNPGFVPVSWEEAMNLLADKIIALRQSQETEKFLLMRGRYSDMADILYSSVPKIIGSPNNISHSSICAENEKMGCFFTENNWGYRDYDLQNTRYMLLWGVDPLASNRQVPETIRFFGAAKDQGKIAVVDPRLSASAAKADEWLPIIPGEDGALASAIAHQILVNGAWYRPFVGDFADGENHFVANRALEEGLFVEKHTYGLIKWWNIELKDRTPEWAAPICGIPAEQIIRIATGLGNAAPNATVWYGPTMFPRGTYAAMAVHALAGLVGAIDNVGGTLKGAGGVSASVPKPDNYMDDLAKKHSKYEKCDHRGRLEWPNLASGKSGGGVNTNRVADAIAAKDPYDIKLAIGYFCNFLHSAQGSARWATALEQLPFFAHITTHYSETSHYADLILPAAHHMFERWSFSNSNALRHKAISLQQQLVTRVFDVKNDETEIVWLLAEALAKKGFSNLHDYLHNEFPDPETGKKPETLEEFALSSVKFVTKNIWDPQFEKKGDSINGWKEFVNLGVWNSQPVEYRKRWEKFGTKTDKFEFYSETLKESLQSHADKHNTDIDGVMQATGYEARGELAFVPHYESPLREGDVNQFPFLFIDYKSRLNREGRSQNCPWYYEFKSVDPGDNQHDDVIKINPADASAYGLRDGDQVKISSSKGTPIVCTLKLWEGIRPGCAAKSYGQGHWAYGRFAAKEFLKGARGGNNNSLMHAEWDHLSGSSARNGGFCRVKIEKA